MKKYELIENDTKIVNGKTLYRIRALVAISLSVAAGDLGGYVESEKNLSHNGNAWVSGNARVSGNAVVSGNAEVSGNAVVSDNAWVSGNAVVSGNAEVYGDAWVSGNARVYGNAVVSDNAWVSGNAEVSGDAWVSGNAEVSGNARVYGNAWVYGDAWVSGNAEVSGNARVSDNAWVSKSSDVQWFSHVGSENGTLTVFRTKDGDLFVTRGCFSGTMAEFEAAVNEKHGDSKIGRQYKLLIQAIELYFSKKS